MEQPFEYAKLPSPSSIRLLELDFSRDGGIIDGRLIVVDVHAEGRPQYICLSYTWGTPFLFAKNDPGDPSIWDKVSVLKLTDSSTGASGVISITRNLHEFLIRLTRNEAAAHIWIDAICINQQDLAERASQVQLMSDIYESCAQTIVWLGPEDQNTSEITEMMAAIASPKGKDWKAAVKKTPSPSLKSVFQSLDIPFFSEGMWGALGRLYERSWFHRVWTVQESVLPGKVIFFCGRFQMSLLSIRRGAYMIRQRFEEGIDPTYIGAEVSTDKPGAVSLEAYRAAHFIDRYYNAPTNPYDNTYSYESHRQFWAGVSRVPTWLQSKLCADPRDHVYAALGLHARDGDPFPVDYTKPTEDVFTEFCLKQDLGVSNLINKEHSSITRVANLPSWVPDLSAPLYISPWYTKGGAGYRAGGSERFECQLVSEQKVLRLPAFELDNIQHLGGSFMETQNGAGLVKSLGLLDTLNLPTLEGQDLIESFWRTLIANLPGYSNRAPKAEIWGPSFRSFCRYYLARWVCEQPNTETSIDLGSILDSLHQKTNSPWLPSADEVAGLAEGIKENDHQLVNSVIEGVKTYTVSLKRMFMHHIFFITRGGRMGIGPQALTTGTQIFVVKGCGYPVLIQKGREGRYRLDGHVYVEGVMHGEALKWGRFMDIELE
ncbi:heterokaryon incompatibility protein-domain-containing protein [Hypomontagnella submonticulosa]|nr:heterokaryon incompatibility protein-domain-containing protein [Hypomontagnella submonticulosa]